MNIYFLCATQHSNLGDLVINRMLVKELSIYGTVFIDSYGVPDNFKKYIVNNDNNIIDIYEKYGFSLKKGNFLQFLNFARKENLQYFIQSPGPIIHIKNIAKRLYFKLLHWSLIKNNITFLRIGNCVSALLSKGLLPEDYGVKQYYIRSKESVSKMQQMGAANVNYIPDLAYLLDIKESSKDKIVAINFRSVDIEMDTFVIQIREICQYLASTGYKVIFYYQVLRDYAFMKNLYDEVKCPNVEFVEDPIWFDTIDFYKDKVIVISNRLHSLLLGMSYGAIPYALVENNALVAKIRDVFISSFDGKDVLFVSNKITLEKLNQLVDNSQSYRNIAYNIFKNNQELCRSTFEKIFK